MTRDVWVFPGPAGTIIEEFPEAAKAILTTEDGMEIPAAVTDDEDCAEKMGQRWGGGPLMDGESIEYL